MSDTIANYVTSDIGASQSLVTLEVFIGDIDGVELAEDGSIVDTSDAVAAINGLVFSLEQRDAKIEALFNALRDMAEWWAYAIAKLPGAAPSADDHKKVEQLAATAIHALHKADPSYIHRLPNAAH